ncbi:MAG TPA: hypothetical protein PLW31_09940 [Bacteroidales bacterium]|nr:hypothetical protein [Bacteroidales bacterium]HOX78352.1 hypothetical protein [Bacteroidales bacterium]HPI85074.1 hypothetical protein [Bacteroidales bacterium]
MLKRDNIAFGALIGLLLPVFLYGILWLIGSQVNTGSWWALPFETDRMMMLSLAVNIIPIRIYFVSLKYDRTGRGILLSTFLLMVGGFLFIRFF